MISRRFTRSGVADRVIDSVEFSERPNRQLQLAQELEAG